MTTSLLALIAVTMPAWLTGWAVILRVLDRYADPCSGPGAALVALGGLISAAWWAALVYVLNEVIS